MEKNNQLIQVIEQSGLEKSKSQFMLENFEGYFKQAAEWESKAKEIIITDVLQVREMKMAREARLALRDIRIDTEKTRKALKEQSLREGKAIDGIANVIKALIVPIEEHLTQQEKFIEIQEQERKEARKIERIKLLEPYDIDFEYLDILNMPDESFDNLLASTKLAHDQKIEAEKKAEAERIAKEKVEREEQERIRKENECLQKEVKEREKKMEEERKKAETERKAIEEKARKEREEAEAKARKEAKEREKIEAELKAKKESEARAEAEKQAAIEAELSKGDKEKFQSIITDLTNLKSKYFFKSKKFCTLQASINELIDKIIEYSNSKI